ncbi:MAG TPA: hypothetical protein VFF47_07160 [Nitrospirota bacterium]|nr:hypothetical protein [Nitrospirota bacterium]
MLTGCAVKGEEELSITVETKEHESAVVTLGGAKSFFVNPEGTTVTWSVNGIPGGNEGTVGTIDADGKYTAPTDADVAPEQVVITATDTTGTNDSEIAFLTTFRANKRITTHYDSGTKEADTSSAGQRGISVNGDNIYIVWADNSIGTKHQAFFAMSKDGGDNFCKPIRISGFDSANQFSPTIAVYNDDGNVSVYVVWEDYRDGDGDIYFARFDGTDCNWDTTREWVTSPFTSPKPVNASRDTGPSSVSRESSPAIAVDSTGGIYVVWEDRFDSSENYPDIYFAKSSDQGATFPTNTFLDNSGRRPSIAIGPSDIAYVVWEDIDQFPNQPTKIKIRKIEMDIPGSEQELTVDPGYNARYPSIAVDPVCNTLDDDICDVYVVWQRAVISEPKFEKEIVSSYNIDLAIIDGGTFEIITGPLTVPESGSLGVVANEAYPSVAADDSSIYIVWDDLSGETKNVFFTKSRNGKDFKTNRIVNDDLGNNSSGVSWHEKPGIAVADGKAYVIWTDLRDTKLSTSASPKKEDVYNDVYFAVEQ